MANSPNARTALKPQGSIVAIVTPMQPDGALDLTGYRALLDWHVQQGTDGIVVAGTTGESPTVDYDEHCLLIKTTVDHIAGRVPVIAGTGANSTSEAIELSEYAHKAGADMTLSVVPYYNKPSQEGLFLHFKTIAEKVNIPMIVYNVPGRTVADMQNETVLRLAQVPNIVGIKDATANLERGTDLIRRKPRDFLVYSGDDATCLPLMFMGSDGVISVTANIAAKAMHEMCAAAFKGDIAKAREINDRLFGLHRHLFCEANPIPVKWAARQMGLIKDGIRLPLTPLAANFHDLVRDAMRQAGISA